MANSAGFKLYAGYEGSNVITVGKEDSVFNFTSLVEAIAYAKPKDMIKVYPGTYTITTAALSINKDLTIVGMGGTGDVVVTSALAALPTVSINVPASHNATVSINIEDIRFVNSAAGAAVRIDNNGGAAQNLYVNFKDCSFYNSGGGYGVELLQTTATKDIFLTISGSPVLNDISASLFTQTKAASITFIEGMNCLGVFTLDASALAATFDMVNCIYRSAAQTAGGGIGRLNNYIGNMYGASGLGAALTKGLATDFDAFGTEFFATYA
jgi:hypothetical protein